MAAFAQHPPLALHVMGRHGPFANRWVRDGLLIAGAVALLSLLAQVSFEVPFSADRTGKLVPITGQTFAVLLLGVALGARRGVAAVVTYLGIGLLGAPVYASAGAGSAVLFTGATAGYLWGMVLAVAFVGWCADRGLDRGPWLYAVLAVGNGLVYAAGLPVLALWLRRHGLDASLLDAGLWPFVPGDLAKLMAAALAVPGAWSVARRRGR